MLRNGFALSFEAPVDTHPGDTTAEAEVGHFLVQRKGVLIFIVLNH